MKQRIAELRQPPPPLEHTLAELNALATKSYDTKARSRNAIKHSHSALVETLQTLQAWSKYPDLVAPATVEAIHKQIRRTLKLPAPLAPLRSTADVLREADEAIARAEATMQMRVDMARAEAKDFRAQLAAMQAERDDLVLYATDQNTRAVRLDGQCVALQAQYDDVTEALGSDRLKESDGYHGTAVRKLVQERDRIERDTAERIAAWLRSSDASNAWCADNAYDEDQHEAWLANQIRAGAWRKS